MASRRRRGDPERRPRCRAGPSAARGEVRLDGLPVGRPGARPSGRAGGAGPLFPCGRCLGVTLWPWRRRARLSGLRGAQQAQVGVLRPLRRIARGGVDPRLPPETAAGGPAPPGDPRATCPLALRHGRGRRRHGRLACRDMRQPAGAPAATPGVFTFGGPAVADSGAVARAAARHARPEAGRRAPRAGQGRRGDRPAAKAAGRGLRQRRVPGPPRAEAVAHR